MFLVHTDYESGIVDQYVNMFPLALQGIYGLLHSLAVAYVKRKSKHFYTLSCQFLLQAFQLFCISSVQNQIAAHGCKLTCATFTYSAGCTGYKYCFSFNTTVLYIG